MPIPLITQPIPQQSYEIIRSQIAAVLALELGNQYLLDNSFPQVKEVYTERIIPVDDGIEMSLVNVSLAKGEYSNRTQVYSTGGYMFHIDVYSNAKADIYGFADTKAMLTMTRIVGAIRAILMNPQYNILGLPKGIITGNGCRVERFFIADKNIVQDALSDVVGRIQFAVDALEYVQLGGGVPFELGTTTIYLRKGQQYSIDTENRLAMIVTEDGNQIVTERQSDKGYFFSLANPY